MSHCIKNEPLRRAEATTITAVAAAEEDDSEPSLKDHDTMIDIIYKKLYSWLQFSP
jgi:hypothetical protein